MGLNSHIAAQEIANKSGHISPKSLGLLGGLEVRLAKDEIEVAQVLDMREKIFNMPQSINVDKYDAICDHLLVLDNALPDCGPTGKVVGTYRLIRGDQARLVNGFYSSSEFNIEPMLERNSKLNFLEFGRSCVLPQYRGKRTMELLWAGSWAYVNEHKMDVLFGCASFSGCDPNAHKEALSFLHHFAAADLNYEVKVNSKFKGTYDLMSKDDIDPKRAIKALPPIIKGYLRVGAKFSKQIAVDKEFGTVDILTVLPVKNIDERYLNYYGPKGGKHSVS